MNVQCDQGLYDSEEKNSNGTDNLGLRTPLDVMEYTFPN
jgi:hypothetical protein